jgi:hypothetical protein
LFAAEMKRTVIVVTPAQHKRFKQKVDSLGMKLKNAADQAIELWLSSHRVNESQKSLQK